MGKYVVVVYGENCRLSNSHSNRRYWFYATRYLEADSPGAAGAAAVADVSGDSDLLDRLRNPADDPPRIEVEAVEEVESWVGIPRVEGPLSFSLHRDPVSGSSSSAGRLRSGSRGNISSITSRRPAPDDG